MTRRPDGQSGLLPRRGQISVEAAATSSIRQETAKVQEADDLNERLARELVQRLVQSAIASGGDPVARLREFRTLQQAAITMSQDPTVAEAAERLVRAIDLCLRELATAKS
jgi:hypothetical protein